MSMPLAHDGSVAETVGALARGERSAVEVIDETFRRIGPDTTK